MSSALVFRNIDKSYGGLSMALKNFNLEIESGEFFGLLGANGAGKSSLIGMLAGIVTPSSGQITICGDDLMRHPSKAKLQMGIMPQEFNFNVFETLSADLTYQAGFFGMPRQRAKERMQELLERVDLWNKRDAPIRTLSGGMKRRLMLARALLHEPKVVILDEPTAGLDVESRRSMWELLTSLNRAGTTILLTTHYLEEAEHLCRRIGYLQKGNLVQVAPLHEWLEQIEGETYVLTLSEPWKDLDKLMPFKAKLEGEYTLEVSVSRKLSLTDLMLKITQIGLPVSSLRTRENRLETLLFDQRN